MPSNIETCNHIRGTLSPCPYCIIEKQASQLNTFIQAYAQALEQVRILEEQIKELTWMREGLER